MIPDNHKFACLALKIEVFSGGNSKSPSSGWSSTWERSHVSAELEPSLFVSSNFPLTGLGDGWKLLRSSEQTAIVDSNVFATRIRPSAKPEVYDDEIYELQESFHTLIAGMAMVGFRFLSSSFLLSGAKLGGDCRVMSVSTGAKIEGPWRIQGWQGVDPVPMSELALLKAHRIAAVIDRLSKNTHEHRRLMRGIAAWMSAMLEKDCRSRLHRFVQTLESLVPDKGSHRAQELAEKCESFFVPKQVPHASGKQVDLIQFLHNVRSKIEHLDDLDKVIPGFDELRPTFEVRAFAMQAELMATHALRHVLETPQLLEIYRTPQNTAAFFNQPTATRIAQWGSQFDFEKEIADRARQRGQIET